MTFKCQQVQCLCII